MIQSSIKQFYRTNPVPNPINITLTQKQVVDGQRIDDAISSANFKHFRRLLNSRLFGNAYSGSCPFSLSHQIAQHSLDKIGTLQ